MAFKTVSRDPAFEAALSFRGSTYFFLGGGVRTPSEYFPTYEVLEFSKFPILIKLDMQDPSMKLIETIFLIKPTDCSSTHIQGTAHIS